MFTKEFQNLFEDRVNLEKTTFIGNTMVTDIGNGLVAKVEAVTKSWCDDCDELRVKIIAKANGFVDSIYISFWDVWGLQNSYLWRQECWLNKTPSKEEYCLLADAVMDYIALFTEEENKA